MAKKTKPGKGIWDDRGLQVVEPEEFYTTSTQTLEHRDSAYRTLVFACRVTKRAVRGVEHLLAIDFIRILQQKILLIDCQHQWLARSIGEFETQEEISGLWLDNEDMDKILSSLPTTWKKANG